MKYAIVEISGRQFWIETGKYYDLNRIPTELGKEITLNRVLLVNNEGELLIGKPYLESVKVKGKIFVMISDGESTEGSVWEALRYIEEKKVDNIEAIRNNNCSCFIFNIIKI